MNPNGSVFNFDSHFLSHTADIPLSYYLTTVCILLIVSVLSVVKLKIRKHVNIPFYGLDDNDPEAPKKRWMKDSFNLLREGCAKVCPATQ